MSRYIEYEPIMAELEKEVKLADDWKTAHEIANVVKYAPTIDAVSEWIPCSERLPSEQGEYLVTFPLCNGDPWVDVLSFGKGKFYDTDDEWGDVEYDDVTAWMPLPKPYGEREGE